MKHDRVASSLLIDEHQELKYENEDSESSFGTEISDASFIDEDDENKLNLKRSKNNK